MWVEDGFLGGVRGTRAESWGACCDSKKRGTDSRARKGGNTSCPSVGGNAEQVRNSRKKIGESPTHTRRATRGSTAREHEQELAKKCSNSCRQYEAERQGLVWGEGIKCLTRKRSTHGLHGCLR
jgi:hypothetical protein